MSAFCVGYTHIDTLLTAGLTLTTHGPLTWLAAPTPSGDTERVNDQHLRRELRIETANTVGQMLINENARSVNHLYGGEQPELAQRYTYRRLLGPVQPVARAEGCRLLRVPELRNPGLGSERSPAVLRGPARPLRPCTPRLRRRPSLARRGPRPVRPPLLTGHQYPQWNQRKETQQ
jgi:hypothetical protein